MANPKLHRATRLGLAIVLLAAAAACGDDPTAAAGGAGGGTTSSSMSASSSSSGAPLPPPSEDLARGIVETAIELDMGALRATAAITLAPSKSTGASFEVEGLAIIGVSGRGRPLNVALADGDKRLDVGVPLDTPVISIDYFVKEQKPLEGYVPSGLSSVWPYYCGNLFPCHSNPSEGTTFNILLENAPPGSPEVYAPSVFSPGPATMIGWVIGEYTYQVVGTTSDKTEVGVYALKGHEATAAVGTKRLRDVFDWYETNLGPYSFGGQVASVEVDLPPGPDAGLEHHPYWHVRSADMGGEEMHAHEAAHGWFGTSVRIRCWEDLVLSEGTASYLAAHVLEELGEPPLWADYQARLDSVMAGSAPKLAWLPGCNQVDPLKELDSDIPTMKGAFFFRALENKVGASSVVASLADTYAKHREGSAGLQDVLDAIQKRTGYDATACAEAWLREAAVPDITACN